MNHEPSTMNHHAVMHKILILTFLLAMTAAAQSPVTVFEGASAVVIGKDHLALNLVVLNPAAAFDANIRLEILDPDDHIYASKDFARKIDSGRHEIKETIQIDPNAQIDDLIWKRLRWTIAGASGSQSYSDVVSLSQIVPDLFELWISGPNNIYPGMSFSTQVSSFNPVTEKPVADVELKTSLILETSQGNKKTLSASGRTNGDGVATLTFEIPREIRLAPFNHDLKVVGKKNVLTREADESYESTDQSFVYLYTDKPIYQPSQKFHVRGLYLDHSMRPMVDRDLNFEIENGEGESIHSGAAKTSRFGVMTIDWDIPSDAKTGQYSIKITDTEDQQIGKAEFRITRYELPTFAVSAKAAKPFYLIDEKTAEVTVNATYLFGKPVVRGSVRITRATDERDLGSLIDADEIRAEGETDASGLFTGTVDLSEATTYLAKYDDQLYRDLVFAASFTDPTTNRTQQKRFAIRVSRQPINVRIIHQQADPHPDLPYVFYITTFYPDGTPAKCDLRVEGKYRDTNLVSKLADSKTNSYGAARFELKLPSRSFPEGSSEMDLLIKADDRKGKIANQTKRLYVSETNEQMWLKPNKTVYFPKEPILLKIFSSEKEEPVFVEIEKDGKVVYSKSVTTENGRADLLIPYREEFVGELNLNLFNFNDQLETAFPTTIIYPVKSGLGLKIKDLKESYRPNEEAQISLNAERETGDTSESAIGFFVIDKAIEERAEADRLPDNLSQMRALTGSGVRFGELTRRDLDRLDPAQVVSDELQLAADFLLTHRNQPRRTVRTAPDYVRLSQLYDEALLKRVLPLRQVLTANFEQKFTIPMNQPELIEFAAAHSFDLSTVRDPWETPFRYSFRVDREFAVLEFKSAGADKVFSTADDLSAGTIRFEWFRERQERLNTILNNHLQSGGEKPLQIEALKSVWKAAGIDFDELRDVSGRQLLIDSTAYERDFLKVGFETIASLDGEYQQEMRSQLVHQKVVTFRVRSVGPDDKPHTSDDISLASFSVVDWEQSLEPVRRETVITKQPISGKVGLLRGTIVDRNGAVISGAVIEIENQISGTKRSVKSSDVGEFQVPFIEPGKYLVRVSFPGFMSSVLRNIVVLPGNSVSLLVLLEVAPISSMVDVIADTVTVVQQSNSQLTTNITRSPFLPELSIGDGTKRAFTPRVREYFPETLVWQPNIVTDKNGRAVLNFKLGDNLTTWKLYAVGSNEKGEFALAEREFRTFQSLFAELEPPRFLTVGDRVALPVPIRNYDRKSQKITTVMEPNDWSRINSGSSQKLEIAPDGSTNAVFDITATKPISDGKQRVTATASKDGDAIEKTVTVRPDGKFQTDAISSVFTEVTKIEYQFPARSKVEGRNAQLRIYPNAMGHVARAVEGLLEKPHGCGEQTTSSTYPNLLILIFAKENEGTINPALRARAETFLNDGYQRLLGYQTSSGGFAFWGRDDQPNAVLTAYVLRFLADAEDFIDVDEAVVERAEDWLLKSKPASELSDVETASMYRSLAMAGIVDSTIRQQVKDHLSDFAKSTSVSNDAFVTANLALAAFELGETELAKQLAARLTESALRAGDAVYWNADKTATYGWGAAAQIETTAIALQALVAIADIKDPKTREIVAGANLYLLKSKDRDGVWRSTHTTIHVLTALIELQRKVDAESAGKSVKMAQVLVDEKKIADIELGQRLSGEPQAIDLTTSLSNGPHKIEIRAPGSLSTMSAQLIASHYTNWIDVIIDPKYFRLNYSCDKYQAKIAEPITCRFESTRISPRSGMLTAEIGLPPGADVDRASLDKAVRERNISRYEVEPDRIVVYSWTAPWFTFAFRPRYAMDAQTTPTEIFDYYNDEARDTIAPLRFVVR